MRALWLCLFCAGCAGGRVVANAFAPAGAQVGTLLRNADEGGALNVLDLGFGAQHTLSLDAGSSPASVSAAGGSYFVAMNQPALLVGWQPLSDKPDRTFSLAGFVPSLSVGAGDSVLVLSRDVSSTARVAIWQPAVSSTKGVDAFNTTGAVPVSACALSSDRWLVVASNPGQSALASPDQLAIVAADGTVPAEFSVDTFAAANKVTLAGPAGCAADPESEMVAVAFLGSANVLLLQRAGDILKPVRVLALPSGLNFSERVVPVFAPGGQSVIMPSRSEDMAQLQVDGSGATRLHLSVSGTPRVAARLSGSLLVAVVGDSARIIRHAFDGAADEELANFGAGNDIVDLTVVVP